MKDKLHAPKYTTWLISLVFAILGLLGWLITIPILTELRPCSCSLVSSFLPWEPFLKGFNRFAPLISTRPGDGSTGGGFLFLHPP